MQRYIISKEQLNNDTITITGTDVHHIKDVMRMVEGDMVMCVVPSANQYQCRIDYMDKNKVLLHILEIFHDNNEVNGTITIAQGIVMRSKTEEVVRRLTEIGATSYLRVEMIRCNAKANDDKLERLDAIVKEATEQSHRTSLMNVSKVISFKDLLVLKHEYDYCYYSDCNVHTLNFRDLKEDYSSKKVLVLVGPEGGYDKSEVDALESNGFTGVTFGARVLRTETAPLYIASVLANIMGDNHEN